jgi:hypothetical protein
MPNLLAGRDPDAAPSGGRTPDKWFDISAFEKHATPTGGNLGLQTNTTPPTKLLDFSIFKDFLFTERYRAQFRMETTNLFNTPQFTVPSNNLQNGNFGQITSTYAGTERHIQLALRFQF